MEIQNAPHGHWQHNRLECLRGNHDENRSGFKGPVASLSKIAIFPVQLRRGRKRTTIDWIPFRLHFGVGIHVLQIGGRSKGVKLDQIVWCSNGMRTLCLFFVDEIVIYRQERIYPS